MVGVALLDTGAWQGRDCHPVAGDVQGVLRALLPSARGDSGSAGLAWQEGVPGGLECCRCFVVFQLFVLSE